MRHRLDNRAGQDGEDEHTHTQKCTNRQTNKPKKLEDSLVLLVLVVPMEFFFWGGKGGSSRVIIVVVTIINITTRSSSARQDLPLGNAREEWRRQRRG